MGKTRTKRCKTKKAAPTGLPSEHDIEAEEENLGAIEDPLPDVITSITDKLRSPSAEEKEWACRTVTNITEQDMNDLVKPIVESDVIRMLSSLLVDSSPLVKHSAVIALRHLANIGGHDFCDVMVDEDVFTPLVVLFRQYSPNWVPSVLKKDVIDTQSEIFVEAINLVWSLCESSEAAVTIFNRENILPLLMHSMNPVTHGTKISVATAYCIHTISEDNPELCEKIHNHTGMFDTVKALVSYEGETAEAHLLRVLGSGIIMNLSDGKISKCPLPLMATIMNILSHALTVDVMVAVRQLYEMITERESLRNGARNEKQIEDAEDKEMSSLKSSIEKFLSCQTIALEIITNICCSEDSSENGDEMDSSDASDEIYTDMDMCDGDVVMEKFPMNVTSEVHEAIVSHNLLHKALGKVSPPDNDIAVSLKSGHIDGSLILKRLTSLQCRSLFCAHNIIECLDHVDLGGATTIHNIWLNLAKHAFEHTYMCLPTQVSVHSCKCPEHLEFVEGATSAMRIVIRNLAQLNTNVIRDFTSSDMQILCEAAHKSGTISIQRNIINIMGTLGSNNASDKDNCDPEVIKKIGIFLLEMCNKEANLVVVAEALDAIFDVFAEDYLDPIAQEISLVAKLQSFLPIFKNKIQHKKNRSSSYPVIMTAKTNLVRFIRYKLEQTTKNGHK